MEIKINREIREYTESMFFGLSLRQFIFSLVAVLIAVGIYFILKPYLGTETVSWLCILGATPFAVMGFVKYNGMTAEQFARAWLHSEFIIPKKLTFQIYNESVNKKTKMNKKSRKAEIRYENIKKTNPARQGKIQNSPQRSGYYTNQRNLERRNFHGGKK